MNPALSRDYSNKYTPADVVDMLIDAAEITEEMSILEPSAGDGAIVRAIRSIWSDNVKIHAVEINSSVVKEKLLDAGADVTMCGDFLLIPLIGAEYDTIIANPPFGNETNLGDHFGRMWLSVRCFGLIVMIAPVDFKIPRWTFGKEENRIPLENWATNKDGTTTPICIIKFRKH